MKTIIKLSCILIIVVSLTNCNIKANSNSSSHEEQKDVIVGGGCDGCEIMYQNMPKNLSSVDTSAGWNEQGQKLIIEGNVFKLDRKTSASNVIIYYWQTDNTGLYSKTAKEKTIHGHLRGWLKTDANGHFKIFTIRPASYPNSTMPAHIHFSIKEPNIPNEYYIDDILFDDDKFLNDTERKKLEQRGGNGIVEPETVNNVQVVQRNIILGLNIPNYPK